MLSCFHLDFSSPPGISHGLLPSESLHELTRMALHALSSQEVDAVQKACPGDQSTADFIEAFCSSKSSMGRHQLVKKTLLVEKGTAASFASALSDAIGGLRKARGIASAESTVASNGVLKAVATVVSKILEMGADMGDGYAALHRELRQPTLLLALVGVVQDNGAGSGAQRAAASALVAFCEASPLLWKELAKEIRCDADLLRGFLSQITSLRSIADHRTQELAFECVYRMWKVWKKQSNGPPVLPPGTRQELRRGLDSIATKDFETGVRALLMLINKTEDAVAYDSAGVGAGDPAPPVSFAIETIIQVADCAGIGSEEAVLGDANWLDVGGDSISFEVQQKGQGAKGEGPSSIVFVSIPAEVVASSSELVAASRSLRVDVPFSHCASLARVARKLPATAATRDTCSIIIRLKEGAEDFARLRKAIVLLVAGVEAACGANESTPAKVSLVSTDGFPEPRGVSAGHAAVQRLPAPLGPSSATTRNTVQLRRSPRTARRASRLQREDDAAVPSSGQPPPLCVPETQSALEADVAAVTALHRELRMPLEDPSTPVSRKTLRRESADGRWDMDHDSSNDELVIPSRRKRAVKATASRHPVSGLRGGAIEKGSGPSSSAARQVSKLSSATKQGDGGSLRADQARLGAGSDLCRHVSPGPSSAMVTTKRGAHALSRGAGERPRREASSRALRSISSAPLPEPSGDEGSGYSSGGAPTSAIGRPMSDASEHPGHGGGAAGNTRGERELGDESDESDGSDGSDDSRSWMPADESGPDPDAATSSRKVGAARRGRPPQSLVPEVPPRNGPGRKAAGGTRRCSPTQDVCFGGSEGVEEMFGGAGACSEDAPTEQGLGDGDHDSLSLGENAEDFGRRTPDRGSGDEDDDTAIFSRLLDQLVAAATARSKRSKKRKADAVIEETRRECNEFFESTAQVLRSHWQKQFEELLEQAREAEGGVRAAREHVEQLTRAHQQQWAASTERIQKHAARLKELTGKLDVGPSGTSKLEREWQGDLEATKIRLQKQRDGTVSRFFDALTATGTTEKAKGKTKGGGDRSGCNGNDTGARRSGSSGGPGSLPVTAGGIAGVLNHLTLRLK